MFERFGEFGSMEELNAAAAGLVQEGDWESLKILAEENGIDVEEAQDYMTGETKTLVTPFTAALGRLKVLEKASKLDASVRNVIFRMIEAMMQDADMPALVMKKGKSPDGLFDQMREEAKKHRVGNVAVVCGTDRDLQQRIRRYYSA